MSIYKRMKEATKGLTVAKVAILLNEKESRVRAVLYGKQKAPEDLLIKFIEKFEVDANWLLLGVGESPAANLDHREAILLDHFRHCDAQGKDAMLRTGSALAKSNISEEMKKTG